MQDRKFSNILSRDRASIMGFAILWIVLFHAQYNHIINCELPIVGTFLDYGYGGVDLFVFLSGFGVYHSFCKNPNIKEFYLRRMKRVLPIYLFSVVFLVVVFDNNGDFYSFPYWLLILKRFWFMPCIILFYLIFLFIYHRYIQGEHYQEAIIIFCIIYFLYLFFLRDSMVRMIVTRLPIFIFGAYLGKVHLSKIESIFEESRMLLICFMLGLIVLVLEGFFGGGFKYLGIYHFAFILITPYLSFLIAVVTNRTNSNFILNLFGKYSLELYLGHGFSRLTMKLFGVWDFCNYLILSIFFTLLFIVINKALTSATEFKLFNN